MKSPRAEAIAMVGTARRQRITGRNRTLTSTLLE